LSKRLTGCSISYQQGFDRTSFSDIAGAVNISRGNFYYHFKTKDQILDAVICLRQASTRRMLECWEISSDNPVDRIRSFIHIVIDNREKIERYGCPVGTLATELAKINHASQGEAKAVFTLFRTWLRKQFILLGCKDNADGFAMHLLARSQGVATLTNAFGNREFVDREVKLMCEWLESCRPDAAEIAGNNNSD